MLFLSTGRRALHASLGMAVSVRSREKCVAHAPAGCHVHSCVYARLLRAPRSLWRNGGSGYTDCLRGSMDASHGWSPLRANLGWRHVLRPALDRETCQFMFHASS